MDPISFIEVVVWLLRMTGLAGKSRNSCALLMRAPNSGFVVLLLPPTLEDFYVGGWGVQDQVNYYYKKENQDKGHIILIVSYVPCADFLFWLHLDFKSSLCKFLCSFFFQMAAASFSAE